MKDFVGNELTLGDTVAVAPKNYRGLIRAQIIKFTPQQVRVKYKNTWNFGTPGRDEEYLVYPGDLMLIEKAG